MASTNYPVGTKAFVTNNPSYEAEKVSDDEWATHESGRLIIFVPDEHMAEYLSGEGQFPHYYTLVEESCL